jgi:alkanesulfonate monooxygenase SsuD/methylene tetrahydromethanopterin reductase-like flavin-dependent oxidoreductase (luciferase family)
VKIISFTLMAYPYLPDDFEKQYHSVYIDIPSELYDPALGHKAYNDYLDELELAASLGFDGVGMNEHHSNAYGLMPSPNIMAASLARRTKDCALVVLGDSIVLHNPSTRIAEEFAMLDVMSGGRMVAGFPLGTAMDTNYAYGQTPITMREKYREAHDLIIKAWTEPEPFIWNGKYNQLRYVNIWPRPIQKPHPPIWIPGGSSPETWEWVIEHDYLYAHTSVSGHTRAKYFLDHYFSLVEAAGKEPNPYRLATTQPVFVANSESEAEEMYSEAVDYFFDKCRHIYPGFANVPGYQTMRGIKETMDARSHGVGGYGEGMSSWKERVAAGAVVAGTPDQVAERLRDYCKTMRIGHLLALLQFGNLDRERTMFNVQLFAEKVLPQLKDLWEGEWEDHWWINPLAASQRATVAAR